MKIIATKVLISELKAGDLFSVEDQQYWDRITDGCTQKIGEMIYIRTDVDSSCLNDSTDLYKITIIQ